ncbi:MAG: M4 family metallopeptidase [Bradymonadales bacterium]|nr:M4 family metallopeptidase [Bradymonadales bacterium]
MKLPTFVFCCFIVRDMSQFARTTITHYRQVASNPTDGHRNSAIPSLATYLLADPNAAFPAAEQPNEFRSIGIEKVEEIFFRALRLYLRSTATFDDARYAMLRACEDLAELGRAGIEWWFRPGRSRRIRRP